MERCIGRLTAEVTAFWSCQTAALPLRLGLAQDRAAVAPAINHFLTQHVCGQGPDDSGSIAWQTCTPPAGILEMCQSGESACAASSRNQEVLTARNCFAPSLTFLIRSPLGCNECHQRSLISWISGWIVRCTTWHYFSKIPTIRSDSTFPISKIYSISADRQPKLCSKPSQTPLHNAAAY